MTTVFKPNTSTYPCYLSMVRLFFVLFICLFFVATAECVTPVSNAGLDRAVEPGTLVQLDGAGSTPEGASYQWQQSYDADDGCGGPTLTLEDSNTLTPSFMPVESENGEMYCFTLVVLIIEGESMRFASDSVKISVRTPGTFNVPSDEYPTIESALEVAKNIDTVILEGGEYSENNLVVGNGVRIVGAGPESTVISGTNSGPVFIISRSDGSISEISSLTIKEGKAVKGAAILCDKNSNVNIDNVTFIGNKADDDILLGGGGGVYISDGAEVLIKHCRFIGNFARFDYGSAVFVAAGGGALINNSWFTDNNGAAIAVDGTRDNRINITNNIFWGNVGTYSDAVFLDNWADVALVNNTFFENGTLLHNDRDGSGTIRLINSSTAEIRNNIFSNNRNKTTVFSDTTSTVGILYNDFWMNGKGSSEFIESADSLKELEDNEETVSNNMFVNPLLVGPYPYKDFFLASFPQSPCRGAGTEGEEYNDVDGSRNDIGFSGGPFFYMPEPEKEVLDTLRRFYSEFGAHIKENDIDALSRLFASPRTSEDGVDVINSALSEWRKTQPFWETLFDESHLILYLANPTNISLSSDGKTAWVSENAEIRQFKKDSFAYGESITWLKKEQFVLSSEDRWLRIGDGSAVIPNWSIKILRTANGDFNNYSLQADFEPKDVHGIPVEDIKQVVLILPNGQEKAFLADGNGVFHVVENTFSPMDGLYTLRVVDGNDNEILTSRRISLPGLVLSFPEIPIVRFAPDSGSSIEWERVPGAKSYTVEIRRDGEDTLTFNVEDSESFGGTVSFFPVLPDGTLFALKSDDLVRVIARNTTSDEQQVSSASEALLILSPGVPYESSVDFHVVDLDGNSIRASRINFLNGGLIEDSETGDFSYILQKDKEYIVRFSADLYYPEVFTVRPDTESFSKTVELTILPRNVTSVIVPTMYDAARAMLLFMIAACFCIKVVKRQC